MKYKSVSIGLKRDVRHKPFCVSQVSAQLSAELNDGDDLRDVYKEVYEDVVVIVEEMVRDEKEKFNRGEV